MDLGQQAFRGVQLLATNAEWKIPTLRIADLSLPPLLDLALHRLGVALDAVYADRQSVD
jgi:hypothetical protein